MRILHIVHGAFLVIASMLITPIAHADGSVSFKADVVPILKSRPLFEQFTQRTFSITDAGWAVRIDGPTMPKMGGARMGPYRFQAIWHDAQGDKPVTLVIDTKARFFDEHHREISGDDLRRTASIVETLDGIEIEPPRHSVRLRGRRFGCGRVASENVDGLHAAAVVGEGDHREILARLKAGELAVAVGAPIDLIAERLPESIARQAKTVANQQMQV
jgi:hypothetical protein